MSTREFRIVRAVGTAGEVLLFIVPVLALLFNYALIGGIGMLSGAFLIVGALSYWHIRERSIRRRHRRLEWV